MPRRLLKVNRPIIIHNVVLSLLQAAISCDVEKKSPVECLIMQKRKKTTILKNITVESLLGVCALVVLMILELTGIRSFCQLTEIVLLYCRVFVYVSVVMVFFHASGLLYKFKRGDRESSLPKPFLFLIALAAAAAVAFGIWFLVSLICGRQPPGHHCA